MLTTAEKIKVLAGRAGLSIAELAALTGQTRQNLSNKLQRNNFTEADLNKIAQALHTQLSIDFITKDGETI